MWKFAILFGLIAAVASSTLMKDNTEPEANKLTVTVPIYKNQELKCLGVLVHKFYVATSAHCVFGSAASSLYVLFNNDNKTTELLTSHVLVHPYHTPPSLDYDIALLKLKPYSLTVQLQEAVLAQIEPKENDDVDTIYWSLQENGINATVGKATIENRKSCRNKVGNFVSGRMICANVKNPSHENNGPLFGADLLLMGIPSKKVGSNQTMLPYIYTNIANSEIKSFIERYI